MYKEKLFFELTKTWEKFYRDCGGKVNPFIFAISNRGESYIYISDNETLNEIGDCKDEDSFKDFCKTDDFCHVFLNEAAISKNIIYHGKPVRNIINIKTWSNNVNFPLPIAVREINENKFLDKPKELCSDIFIRMQHARELRNLFANLQNEKWYFDFRDMNECNGEWFCPKFDGLCIEIFYTIAKEYLSARVFENHQERENFFYTDYNKEFSFFIGLYHYHYEKENDRIKIFVRRNPLELLKPDMLRKYRIFRDQINLASFDLSCFSKEYHGQIENNNSKSSALYSEDFVYQHDHLIFLTKIFWLAGLSNSNLKDFLIEIRKLLNFIIMKIKKEDIASIDDDILHAKLETLKGEYLK